MRWIPSNGKKASRLSTRTGKYKFVEELIIKDCHEKAQQELEGILGSRTPQVKKIPHLLSKDKPFSYRLHGIGQPSRTIEKMQPCGM